MSFDRGSQVFGLAHWPLIIGLFFTGLWVIFYPSQHIGAPFTWLTVALAKYCESIVILVQTGQWPTEEPSEVTLWTVVPMSALLMVIRMFLQPALKAFAFTRLQDQEKAAKFAESMYRFIYYAPMFFECVHIMGMEDYWPETMNCWRGVYMRRQARPLALQSYYMLELSYYVSGTVAHILFEAKLKDFWVMLAHHLVTIVLIGFSYHNYFHRVGMLVLFVHDVSDIFLEGAKCLKYFDFEMLSNTTFAALIISWVYYRLYLYPVFIVKSAYDNTVPVYEEESGGEYPPSYDVLLCFLIVLQVLHVYWFYLILRVAYRAIIIGDIQDVRDDKAVQDGDSRVTQKRSAASSTRRSDIKKER